MCELCKHIARYSVDIYSVYIVYCCCQQLTEVCVVLHWVQLQRGVILGACYFSHNADVNAVGSIIAHVTYLCLHLYDVILMQLV